MRMAADTPALKKSKWLSLEAVHRPNYVLMGSAVAFLLPMPAFATIYWGWRSTILLGLSSVGWFVGPLFLYIAIRRITETGWSVRLVAAIVLSASGFALWIFAIFVALNRIKHGIAI